MSLYHSNLLRYASFHNKYRNNNFEQVFPQLTRDTKPAIIFFLFFQFSANLKCKPMRLCTTICLMRKSWLPKEK